MLSYEKASSLHHKGSGRLIEARCAPTIQCVFVGHRGRLIGGLQGSIGWWINTRFADGYLKFRTLWLETFTYPNRLTVILSVVS